MYIQPYEPQQSSLMSPPLGHRRFGDVSDPNDVSAPDASLAGDSVSQGSPWSQMLSGVGDAAGALEDGPLGSGLGGMLTSLTSMLQQLAQMIQALVARANGDGGEPGTQQQNPMQPHGHRHSHAMTGDGMNGGCGCGCTQQAQSPSSPNGG